MNDTTRFPSRRFDTQHGNQMKPPNPGPMVGGAASPSAAAIPLNIVDAPSQRLYVSLVYIFLMLWRLYDFLSLYANDTDGFWLFTKWVGIDTAFLYGLSGLRIPWLQWSSSTFTALFFAHGLLNWVLMFRIPFPLLSWLGALTKLLYDRELAVSERKVKPATLLRNSSLILGKQIINILPEGSAIINPEQEPFCVSGSRKSAILPIEINQTMPIQIDILRIDLNTNEDEIIKIPAKDIRKMKKRADGEYRATDHEGPRTLFYTAKQTGLYRLQRVIDQSKLEVLRRPSEAMVVRCPSGSIEPVSQHKCKGDLSNFEMQVDATPPVKIRYSKIVNHDDQGHSVLSIHPESLVSPFPAHRSSNALVALDDVSDVSWARTQSIKIPLNESLGVSGTWQYMIDEVSDAFNNVANYSELSNQDSGLQRTSRTRIEQHFSVHERPRLTFQGCDSQRPMKVEKGKPKPFPIHLSSNGPGMLEEGTYTLLYLFTPQDDVLPDQKHPDTARIRQVMVKDVQRGVEVREPGLYTLLSISSDYCEGEILEPSSCLLENPPEPDLSISYEPIADKCAGSSIGLIVNLDLFGTPPFRVYYTAKQKGAGVMRQVVDVNHLHHQLELRPSHAGHYTYEFNRISDAVYRDPRPLGHKSLLLEQDIKPPASAYIFGAYFRRKACIDEPISEMLHLKGEPPFTLKYELVHHGKRTRYTIDDIEDSQYYLTTAPLASGGEYVLALTSLTDNTGCKVPLTEEVKINVNLQRPRASFGLIDGKRDIFALEGKRISLPLRLQGESPWTLYYRCLDKPNIATTAKVLRHSNDYIDVDNEGTYEITDINDASCPGTVDFSANQFTVHWVPRPAMSVTESPLVDMVQGRYVKKEVCQDDEDVTDISFTGTAPFDYEYEQRLKPLHGSASVSHKKASSGLFQDSIRMETSQAGLYQYKFIKLGDMSYSHNHRNFQPTIIEQYVHPRPSAAFAETGKTYKYCQEEETGGEVVPIMLVGQPPFHLELEIRHHTISKPDIISLPHIETNRYNLHISHRHLALGTHFLTIRKVRDSRGCQRQLDRKDQSVQVTVAELPSITPLEEKRDYCVGDRISYNLAGTPPFNVFYNFDGRERKAKVSSTDFRRIAEKPGEFVITAVSDQRSTDTCRTRTELVQTIHGMPSVRVSKGKIYKVDIHAGGEAEILFEFGGTPPFHFTYTRSTIPSRGQKSEILETKNEISHEHSKTIGASEEGVYEVVSIRDRYCAFSAQKAQLPGGQKLLTNL
ncbi:MAG: hypothetical protein Q9163_005945 [Psora crenata]